MVSESEHLADLRLALAVPVVLLVLSWLRARQVTHPIARAAIVVAAVAVIDAMVGFCTATSFRAAQHHVEIAYVAAVLLLAIAGTADIWQDLLGRRDRIPRGSLVGDRGEP